MNGKIVSLVAAVVAAGLVAVGCAPAAPPPTPTRVPAAPTKAAEPAKAPAAPTKAPEVTKAPEPTRAPTAAPAAAPAKKVEWPEKGKPITIIVTYAPGGSIDVAARMIAPMLEKELGVPVQVVNKAGAAAQLGTTDLALARPDGYTVGYLSVIASLLPYLDPERKAVYGRKDLQTVAMLVVDPEATIVKAAGPFKTLKDLVDAAKARPGEITMGSTGALSSNHLGIMLLQKATGVRFRAVHFDGAGPASTALLGDHIDSLDTSAGSAAPQFRSGQVRYLAIMERQPHPLYAGVPTLESQGYRLYYGQSRGIVAPAGTPREVVGILESAIKKIAETEEYKKKMDEAGLPQRFLGADQFAAAWNEAEAQIKPVYEEAKRELAKQ